MKWSFIIMLFILGKIESNQQRDFIVDYFVFKNLSHVVGFSCCNIKEKLSLVKKFINVGIRTSLPQFNSDTPILKLISSNYRKIGIFVNISCFEQDVLHSLFIKATDKRLYGEIYSWLIFAEGTLNKTVDQLDQYGFGMSTDLVIAVRSSDRYELFDAYNPWKEGGAEINITRLGDWTQNARLNITLTQSKFKRRCNLHQLTLKSHFFRSNYRPKNMSVEDYMRNESFGYKDGLSRFGYNLLVHLSEMYNFTVQFGEIKKWLRGDSLGPMSRSLGQNEIQITGSPVVITQERLRVTKIVYPSWPFRTCFVFRNPQSKYIRGEVLHPFSGKSWYALLIVLVTIFVILTFTLRQESYVLSENIWSNSFLITISSVCQQNTDFVLERVSTRIVFVHLMTFSILIYNYYNATILSSRLHEPILKINDSLNELGKLGFKMASEPMNYLQFVLTLEPQWDRKVFYETKWSKIPESERLMLPEIAMPLVRKGGFAYHTHPDVAYPVIDRTFSMREICEVMEVNPFIPRYSTLSVTYNSTFVELAKVGLSRMSETGLRMRQILRWTSRKPFCNRDKVDIASTDIYEFAPHLFILVVGIVMAVSILMLEFFFARNLSNRQRCEYENSGSSETNISFMHAILVMFCNTKKSIFRFKASN